VHRFADVLDAGGMVVQVDDGCSLVDQHGLVEVVVTDRPTRAVGRDIGVWVAVVEGVRVAEGCLGACLGGAL
jgi:hypothetical protein